MKQNSLLMIYWKGQISEYSPQKSTILATRIYKTRNDFGPETMKLFLRDNQ